MVSVEQVGWLFAKERITAGEHLGPENTANCGLGESKTGSAYHYIGALR